MGRPLAWDIINNVVGPRLDRKGIKGQTTYSTRDWDHGVAIVTPKGTIQVLGAGEVIDENNILGYPEEDED